MRSCLFAAWALLLQGAAAMNVSRRADLREEVRALFKHGYNGYMEKAYPADELRPLSCAPLLRDPDPNSIGINDVHANVSLTLLDSLSTLPMIYPEAYPDAVYKAATQISFDQDVKVQVFEMTIRGLGALLATYQHLDQLPDRPAEQAKALGVPGKVDVKKYAPRMLELALDLGTRLLPAFSSPTGLPYARVNLRRGMEKSESAETCTAGAGSLILEFTLLSRLTGDEQFEGLAQRSFMALWNRRSAQDLVGNGIAVTHGQWLGPGLSGVNAGIDSFFEYALKAAIMLDDSSYMDIFYDAYAAIQTHVRTDDGFIYRPIHLRGLKPPSPSYIDSLSSFFPGVMTLAGDLESAIRGHLIFWNLWRKYSAIPESWEPETRDIGWGGWPGRPEFIESTYYLHRATGDPFYLRVGERVLRDIQRRVLTKCGFATLANVITGELEDRMESFMLSETLKYLYLLFDPSPLSKLTNTVFTTEGHPVILPQNLTRPPSATWRLLHRGEDLFCPIYKPATMGGIPVGIEGRHDYDYARAIVFGPGQEAIDAEENRKLWQHGVCAAHPVPKFAFDVVLAPADLDPAADVTVPHDPSPGPAKVQQATNGDWVVSNIDGIHLGVRWRLDGEGYDVANIGPHRVRQGQQVTITDKRMDGFLPAAPPPIANLPTDIQLLFTKDGTEKPLLNLAAATATFARAFNGMGAEPPVGPAPFGGWAVGAPTLLVKAGKSDGCSPISKRKLSPDPTGHPFVLILPRGGCTFALKAMYAARVGAAGIVVHDNIAPVDGRKSLIRPSADGEPDDLIDEVAHVGVAFIEYGLGKLVSKLAKTERLFVTAIAPETVHIPPAPVQASTRREGRLIVAEHDIINLRVVEA